MSAVLPTAVIAGAPKCGTTSLFRYLSDHPQVCAAADKETRVLLDPDYSLHRPERSWAALGLVGYGGLFAHCDPARHRAVLEATPDYMYQRTALEVLAGLPSRPLVVFVLRRPALRVHSLWRYARDTTLRLPADSTFAGFLEALEADRLPREWSVLRNALEHSRYEGWLERWERACGAGRLHVCLFEELAADPRGVLGPLAQRLGVDPGFYDSYRFDTHNPTTRPRSRRLAAWRSGLAGRLPPGPLRAALGRLYRRLNTRAEAARPGVGELEALRALDARFSAEVELLERRLGRVLAPWRQPL